MNDLLRASIRQAAGIGGGSFALRTGWLIDGTGGSCRRDALVHIVKGGITAVEAFSAEAARDKPCVDASAYTVLPPLVDCHVHLVFSGSRDGQIRKQQMERTGDAVQKTIAGHMEDHWRHGVLAVRDGGDRDAQVLRFKQGRRCRTGQGVQLAATACAWHAKGRYGRMLGQTLPADETALARVAEGCGECDHIKVIQSGMNSLDHFGKETAPQFPEALLRSLVAAAAKAGKPVMAHANGREPVRSAIAAGCRSIEHGYFMGADNLSRLADSGVFWVPTAIPMAALSQCPTLTTVQKEIAGRTLDHQLKQIADARAAGVRIALGTDAGSIGVNHGVAVRQELALLVRAGFSIEGAVGCATQTATELLGIETPGILKPGRPANLLVLPGRPENLTDPLQAFQAGFLDGCWRVRGAEGLWIAC